MCTKVGTFSGTFLQSIFRLNCCWFLCGIESDFAFRGTVKVIKRSIFQTAIPCLAIAGFVWFLFGSAVLDRVSRTEVNVIPLQYQGTFNDGLETRLVIRESGIVRYFDGNPPQKCVLDKGLRFHDRFLVECVEPREVRRWIRSYALSFDDPYQAEMLVSRSEVFADTGLEHATGYFPVYRMN